MKRYFKRVKNGGMLDALAEGTSEEYANALLEKGYVEITKEQWDYYNRGELAVSYDFE